MTHEENMKVISQSVEEEVKRTSPQPYATIYDGRYQALRHGGFILEGGSTVVVNGQDVWHEGDAWQSPDRASARCEKLTRLLQEAYNKGYVEGKGEEPHEETPPQTYPLNQVPIPEGWEWYAFREPKFDEYFLTETGAIGYQDGGVNFKGREALHIIVRNEGEGNDIKDV